MAFRGEVFCNLHILLGKVKTDGGLELVKWLSDGEQTKRDNRRRALWLGQETRRVKLNFGNKYPLIVVEQ